MEPEETAAEEKVETSKYTGFSEGSSEKLQLFLRVKVASVKPFLPLIWLQHSLKLEKILIIDGDLGLGNVNVLLGFHPKFNLYHVMKGHRSIRDIVYHTPEGVDVIPGANGYTQFTNLDDNSRKSLIDSFSVLDTYDYILIDTGAGIGQNVISFSIRK